MITVGLTGNVASGKTAVADRWRAAGALVIDADRLGHAVLAGERDVRSALVEAFGPGILAADGAIDRTALGEAAFATPEGTVRLNAIVHPPLVDRLRRALEQAEAEGAPLAVVDAALVFELGFQEELDRIVLVTAPREVRAERLRRERGMEPARIERIMAAQQPDIEKARASDYVIVNDGPIEHLWAKADAVIAAIRAAGDTRKEGKA
ncbi:MAG TPA: dephospho-CoA kinase [Gemmatimonadota bacterium]|nr:dephospho-CoA kinase [Gemmatimonadota bacterium]